MKAHVYASDSSSRFLVFYQVGTAIGGTRAFESKAAAREHLHSLGYVRGAKVSASASDALESWRHRGPGLCFGCAVSPERRRRSKVCAKCEEPGLRGPEHAETR